MSNLPYRLRAIYHAVMDDPICFVCDNPVPLDMADPLNPTRHKLWTCAPLRSDYTKLKLIQEKVSKRSKDSGGVLAPDWEYVRELELCVLGMVEHVAILETQLQANVSDHAAFCTLNEEKNSITVMMRSALPDLLDGRPFHKIMETVIQRAANSRRE